MKLTKFQIEDDKIFEGFSDGSTRNGWSNPYFTLEVAKEVLEYYQNQSNEEAREQWINWKLEVDKTFLGIDLYYFGGGYIWSEVTEEIEQYKSNSGCELEDVTDEFYNEKGELKQ